MTGTIIVEIPKVGSVTISGLATKTTNSTVSQLDLDVSGTGLSGSINLVVQATITNLDTDPPPLYLIYSYQGSILQSIAKGAKAPTSVVQTGQTWVDAQNNAFGTSGVKTNIVENTGVVSIPTSSDGVTTSEFAAQAPYSITTSLHITTTGGTSYGISYDLLNEIDPPAPTPEPATLVLAIVGAPVLGVGAWLDAGTSPLPP